MLTAGILVGGQSKRMGLPKSHMLLPSGESLLGRTVRVLQQANCEVVLLGECPPLPPELGGLQQLPDRNPNIGPIGGLYELLDFASEGWVLLMACDMPRIDVQLIELLQSCATTEVHAIVFETADGNRHPCCALYHTLILDEVGRHIDQQRYSMNALLQAVVTQEIVATAQVTTQLLNLNSPTDLEKVDS